MNNMKANRRTPVQPFLQHSLKWIILFTITATMLVAGAGAFAAPTSPIPVGQDSYKISVNEDGIYEVTYAELQAAGMDVTTVDPTTFEMMHKGDAVAYALVGDGDNVFEAGESVRFYGQAFSGSNHDKMFVNENYYWIWAGGTPTAPQMKPNLTGNSVVSTFRETVIHDEDDRFAYTGTNDWDDFEFESTSWYKTLIWSNDTFGVGYLPTRTYGIDLVDPDPAGTTATIMVEALGFCESSQVTEHVLQVDFAGASVTTAWSDRFGKVLQTDVNPANLVNGANVLDLALVTPDDNIKPGSDECAKSTWNADLVYYNRAIIKYDRLLSAINNELIFSYDDTGTFDFVVDGFTESDPAKTIFWNVTNPLVPSALPVSAANITDNGGTFSWTMGEENVPGGEYIATTTDNLRTVSSISRYDAPAIEPTGGAEWIAISHADFISEAERLATHRQGNGTTTHVVDIEDIINQFGYGYNIPQAIEAYLDNAYFNWTTPPTYTVIFGDATVNPLKMECIERCVSGQWGNEMDTYVVTDLLFQDRFDGLIPTDHTFADVTGDLSPEIAVGRFAVSTLQEAVNVVDKTILFEQNVANDAAYLQNVLFLADNTDGGGDFCETTKAVSEDEALIGSFTGELTTLCLDDTYTDPVADGGQGLPIDEALAAMRTDLFSSINAGSGIVNYRGHGSANNWGINDNLVSWNDHIDLWDNPGEPVVIISADCLEGHFAKPFDEQQGLAEKFIEMENLGTAAHWSSTGLGFDREHTALHQGFYIGLYTEDYRDREFYGDAMGGLTIGDAIIYSKTRYVTEALGNDSEIWAFTLQGDPALVMPNAVPIPEQPSSVEVSMYDTSVTLGQWMVIAPAAIVLTVSTASIGLRRREDSIA